MILDCQNISKAFGTNVILDNVSFHLEDKEKMAIVGINGAGKTTLLKIIMQEEEADSGQIVLSKDRTIGYLSQHQDIFYDDTVYGVMEDAMKPVIELQDKIRKLEQDMTTLTGDELKSALSTYNRYTHEFEYKNGYAYESEITGVLKGLGFSKEDFDRHTDTLSGGQKTRLSLGRLLLTKPDIIILDEPTNHLDMDSISWLETFLTGYQGSVILVSHDRYFLDKIVTKVVELDRGHSTVYNGNYTYFSQKRAEIRTNKMKAYLNQQADIKHQEEVITKLKQFNREKSIKRAESREKMLDRVERLDKPTELNSEMRLTLEPSVISGEDVLTIEGLSKAFEQYNLFSDKGKLDVAKALDMGVLSVIKDIGLKEPYIGQTQLVSGEIAEDLTYYFATSEQIPTSVALGVLMEKNNTVKQAGGFIIQLMPFASEELISDLEKRLGEFTSITALLDQGMEPLDIVKQIFEGYNVEVTDTIPTKWHCNCSKERFSQAVISLGKKEIANLLADNKPIEVNCQFCNSSYTFSPEELENMLLGK